ncbi:PREDICTED: aspartic proteinase CDR1-like [Lupinus angustifolius]|uniref:aspartic proteinase CDR1-like n=1 Tax=Lupinus angustifolius TaxID=3871 RepID=UPI00092E3F49|nr:PREDICTED: aspartic proteinase CDR1-like [Lupinus angustifolius]
MNRVLYFAIILFHLSIPSSAKPNGLNIDLIHRDSPLSPFYNSSLAHKEVLINAAMRSISRNKAGAVIIPNNGDYLMKIFIGTPPIESLAIVDIGIDHIWVQHSESCSFLKKRACIASTQCRKHYLSLKDRSILQGDLAIDNISFGPNNGPLITYSKTILRCENVNIENLKSRREGVIGLGGGPLSLVSQLGDGIGHIFSYCLISYTKNITSKLKIGSVSTMPPNVAISTTPLVSESPYTLKLESVSVESTKLKPSQSLNMIIDSSTTLTYIAKSFYDSIEISVADAVEYDAVLSPPKPYKLCYELGSMDDDVVPSIKFHFPKVDMHLPKHNVFVNVGNNLCLSIVPTEGVSVLGNSAQVNFKVEFDLKRNTVSFAPTDCTKE